MEIYKPRILKRQVSIRTTAAAGQLLDDYLKAHPEFSETKVTADALTYYFDNMKAGISTIGVLPAEPQAATTLTPG